MVYSLNASHNFDNIKRPLGNTGAFFRTDSVISPQLQPISLR